MLTRLLRAVQIDEKSLSMCWNSDAETPEGIYILIYRILLSAQRMSLSVVKADSRGILDSCRKLSASLARA